jgi:hypothetical protein
VLLWTKSTQNIRCSAVDLYTQRYAKCLILKLDACSCYTPTESYSFTALQLYNATALQLYTRLQLYNSTALQLYSHTALQSYNSTALQPYISTSLQLYSSITLYILKSIPLGVVKYAKHLNLNRTVCLGYYGQRALKTSGVALYTSTRNLWRNATPNQHSTKHGLDPWTGSKVPWTGHNKNRTSQRLWQSIVAQTHCAI